MYLFRPPVRMVPVDPTGCDPLWSKVRYAVGDAVLRLTTGGYLTVEIYDPNLAGVEAVYLGGHDHVITDTEAASLTAAGYGQYLEVVG